MATYHCAIKIGRSGKTIPHLDYIKREGRYQKDASEHDVITTKSGHMPVFAQEDEREFWNACAAHDVRSYREIEFALPNELSHEEQIKLVEEFIEEVIPHNPYTYAIHEVDSAVHGIKNPHCHLMFSERMINDIVVGMEKHEFFKMHGIDRTGNEYGGSVKDRSWAGRGQTAKYYEVRKALADCINHAYEKNGLSIRVDHRSISDQSADELYQGNIEAVATDRTPQIRVNEHTFRTHATAIKEAIHNEEGSIDTLPFRVQERILHERLRLLDRRVQELTEDYNNSLEPSRQEQFLAIRRIAEATQPFMQTYHTAFSYLKKKMKQVQAYADNLPDMDTEDSIVTKEIAFQQEARAQEEYLLSGANPAMVIADLEITKAEITQQLAAIPLTPVEALQAVVNQEDKEMLARFDRDLRSAKNRIFMATETDTGINIAPYQDHVRDAGAAFKSLYDQYHTPEVVKQAKEMQAADAKRLLYYKPRKLETYEEMVLKQELGYNPFKEIKEQIRSKESLLRFLQRKNRPTKKVASELQQLKATYDLMRPKYVTPTIRDAAMAMKENHAAMFNKLSSRTLRTYEETLMNKASDGAFYKERNRLNYHARKLRDVLRSEAVTKASTDAITYITNYRNDFIADALKHYEAKITKFLASQTQRKERLEAALHKTERLLDAVNQAVSRKAVEEHKETIRRVIDKHAKRKKLVRDKTADAVSRKLEAIKKYKEMSRPLSWYEDKHLNAATGGALNRYKQQLRSKQSLRKYRLSQGWDTSAIDKEIVDVQQSIQAVRNQFMTPAIQAAAKQEYEATLKQRPRINARQERQALHSLSRKRHASRGTRMAARSLASSIGKMFSSSFESKVQDANIRVIGRDDDNEFKKFHY